MNFINSWKAHNKQSDKFILELRFGRLTVFELSFDWSSRNFRFILFNFGWQSND